MRERCCFFCLFFPFFFLSFMSVQQDFGFDKQEIGGVGGVNALQTGRRRATKKATAYSKATVQLLSHAKHSNVLCKGWAGRELREDLSQVSHLKHTQTKLGPLCLMHHGAANFLCELLWWEKSDWNARINKSLNTLRCVLLNDYDLQYISCLHPD